MRCFVLLFLAFCLALPSLAQSSTSSSGMVLENLTKLKEQLYLLQSQIEGYKMTIAELNLRLETLTKDSAIDKESSTRLLERLKVLEQELENQQTLYRTLSEQWNELNISYTISQQIGVNKNRIILGLSGLVILELILLFVR